MCRFEIIYNNDYDNRYTYNLNRNFVKPLKKVKGWELYEIPFITGDNEYTEPMTILTSKDKSAYADLEDTVDEFEGERPQRHNIIFDDGWPNNTWYSTAELRKKRAKQQAQETQMPQGTAVNYCPPPASDPNFISGKLDEVNGALGGVSGTLGGVTGMVSGMMGGLLNGLFANELREKVSAAIKLCGSDNTEEITEMVMNSLEDRLDALTDQIADNVGAMTDHIEGMIDGVENQLGELQTAVEEMQDALED